MADIEKAAQNATMTTALKAAAWFFGPALLGVLGWVASVIISLPEKFQKLESQINKVSFENYSNGEIRERNIMGQLNLVAADLKLLSSSVQSQIREGASKVERIDGRVEKLEEWRFDEMREQRPDIR